MKNINAIFDVGSNNGVDGINYAVFNPKCTIYAFEPNPFLRSTIINNKKKVENRLNYKIQNFKLVEKAVSDFNGRDNFYIANEDLCSSLLRYNFVSVKKKITVDIITLARFCQSKRINNIIYLHVDTQGNDLKVLIGLKNYRANLYRGVLETSKNIRYSRYKDSHSITEIKKYFLKWKFKITKLEPNHLNHQEYNVFFLNPFFKNKENNLKAFIFNRRFIQRIIDNREKFKDKLVIILIKFLKYFRLF